jgi:hypothetical protein
VVQARSPEGPISVDSDTDANILYGGPLAVMINRYSASASEIAAAALQDYDRALVVGDSSSFGKGTVQSLNPLRPFVWPATPTATNDPGVVKITIRKFYRVSGASTQFKGVVPNIILPDPLDYRTDLESESTLDNPLPWDTIPSATYTKFGMVQPYVAELGKKSAARIATNQDFAYIQQDIAEIQKSISNKSITLNEHDAIKERQTNQARQKARDAERAARNPLNVKIYNISLADADKSGLPAPVYFPGMLETNYAELNTVALKPTAVNSVTNFSPADKTFAGLIGLDLSTGTFNATGTYTNSPVPLGNLSPADKVLLESKGLDSAAIAGTNLTFLANLTFTNSAVTFNISTVKVKNQPGLDQLDPLLRETSDIMQDYISLLSLSHPLSKN